MKHRNIKTLRIKEDTKMSLFNMCTLTAMSIAKCEMIYSSKSINTINDDFGVKTRKNIYYLNAFRK